MVIFDSSWRDERYSTYMREFRPMKLDLVKPQYFQEEPIPDNAHLAGWAALIHDLDVQATAVIQISGFTGLRAGRG